MDKDGIKIINGGAAEDKVLLKVTKKARGGTDVECDDLQSAVKALAAHISYKFFQKRDTQPFNALLSVVIHCLAMETTGKMQRDFVQDIAMNVPKFREDYKRKAEQLRQLKQNLANSKK